MGLRHFPSCLPRSGNPSQTDSTNSPGSNHSLFTPQLNILHWTVWLQFDCFEGIKTRSLSRLYTVSSGLWFLIVFFLCLFALSVASDHPQTQAHLSTSFVAPFHLNQVCISCLFTWLDMPAHNRKYISFHRTGSHITLPATSHPSTYSLSLMIIYNHVLLQLMAKHTPTTTQSA